MKIKRIDIDSFGTVNQWHSGELDDGINIIYGPNEAGKSTITEFIRSTLFPIRVSKYPGSAKTDSGTISIAMDNGEERTLKREQKKIFEVSGKRTVAEEFTSLDADTYRALYGLDLEQLVNSKLISSGEFRSRFMTIPGGDNIPTITEDINDRISQLMNRDRLTENKIIGACNKEIKEIDKQIAEINESKDQYEELFTQREELKRKVNENKTLVEASQNERLKKKMMRAQSGNLKKMEELEERKAKLEEFASVNTEDKVRYDNLKESIEELKDQLPDTVIDDKDLAVVLSRKDEIEEMYRGLTDYHSKQNKVSDLKDKVWDIGVDLDRIQKDTGWTIDEAMAVRTGAPIVQKAKSALRRDSNKGGFDDKSIMIIGGVSILLIIIGVLFISNIINIGSPVIGFALGGIGILGILFAFLIPRLNLKKAKESFDWND
ncbi:MAG: AAA family ATPase [Candidatus Methanomethylophilaceae archaeon]|nr:AAA family ATPase [Candidatus Methanomethylophilaceae archaeon]